MGKIIEQEIVRINASRKYKNKVVTEVVPFKKFYIGEDYHQEYIANNPGNGYVRNVSIPDFVRFKKEHNGLFKP